MHPALEKQIRFVPSAPRAFHWMAVLLYVGILSLNLYSWWDTWPIARWQEAQLVAGFAVLVLLELFDAWRYAEQAPWYVSAALLVVRLIVIEFIIQKSPRTYSASLFVAVPFFTYFSFGERASIGLGLFLVAFNAARYWYVCSAWANWTGCLDQHVIGLLLLGVSTAFCIAMAKAISTEKASRAHAEALYSELEISHKKLRAYAEKVADLAAAEERNRLARDIHDSLGHYLTAISVQLEKALAFRERNPEEADQAIRDAKRAAKEALQDVRQSMGALRSTQETFCLSEALTALVQTTRRGGWNVEFRMEGQEGRFSKAALLALFRAAQEGLTNIQKHARAERAMLVVRLDENAASLELTDNGCGFDPDTVVGPGARNGNGFGLRGLQERVELIGGSMRIESAPERGSKLLITVPRDPLAPNGSLGMSVREMRE